MTREGQSRLAAARLYVLLDGRESLSVFAALAEQIVAGGANVIQLRDKHLPDSELLERARKLREITQRGDVLFIMNDRPDLAVLARADGVHIGQEELSVKDARTIIGPEGLIGVSTHNLAQARQAVLDGANYLGAGPTFPSRTKSFQEFPGVKFLREVAAEVSLPCYAIGGIDAKNVAEVLATGITHVVASGAILDSADPSSATQEVAALLQR